MGGDEFAVLLPTVSGVDAALEVAQKLRAALVAPFTVDDVALHVEASIGVVVSGEHGADAATLLQRADVRCIPVRCLWRMRSARFVGSVRRGLLDRILIVNAAHARRVLGEYEAHFKTHRPHRSMGQAAPLRALPKVAVDPIVSVIRRDRFGGLIPEYARVA